MKPEEEMLRQLLGDKVSDTSEIEIHTSHFCNLRCAACGQDHESKVGLNSVLEKAEQSIEFIRQSSLDKHTVNFMGGEIFNDEIPVDMFEDYYEFYRRVNDYCLEHGKQLRLNFVTNLIFRENIPHVKRLLSRCGTNVMLSTSYDFAGRGLNLNESLQFKKNLKTFEFKIGVVGFVLTRPSIRKLLLNQDKFFKEVLYPNFHLYFDWYVPEASAAKLMPSEREMLDALMFVAVHYPQISPVKDLLENEQNTMTCFSLNKVTIEPDGREVTCRYLSYQPEQFELPVDYNSNANIIQGHLDRQECFSCPWWNRCQFRCFVNADWAALEREPTCIFRTFFDAHPVTERSSRCRPSST